MTETLPEIPDYSTAAVTIDRLRETGVLDDVGADFSLVLDLQDEDADFDRFEAIGRFLGRAYSACRFWIADWLIFGEGAFGERFYQAAEATGLSESTLVDYARVAGRVPRSRRRAELHFRHHREVAKLPPEEQDRWLQRSVDLSLSARELADEIAASAVARPESTPGPGEDPIVDLVRVDRSLLSAIVREASEADDPRFRLVPDELVVRLRAAIGEES